MEIRIDIIDKSGKTIDRFEGYTLTQLRAMFVFSNDVDELHEWLCECTSVKEVKNK